MKVLTLTGISALALCGAAHADVSISNKSTQNMSCDAGVCTATAKRTNLNIDDLTSMLAAGDVTVKTGPLAVDISLKRALTWSSGSRLTLDAERSIEFTQSVTVADNGALTLITNDGGTGGDYAFAAGAHITFRDLNSSLIINGQTFTLVPDIKTLASDVSANPSGSYALASNYNASPDGTYLDAVVSTPFQGTFEGLGNTLSGLTIDHWAGGVDEDIGLFATSSGVLRDVTLRNVSVTTSQSYTTAGGLVGGNGGAILRVSVDGKVVSSNHEDGIAGMVVGKNWGHVSDVDSSGKLTGASYAGGLVGYNYSGVIENSASAATVTGGAAGGAVGLNYSSIRLVHALGAVHGFDAGGLLGHNDDGGNGGDRRAILCIRHGGRPTCRGPSWVRWGLRL